MARRNRKKKKMNGFIFPVPFAGVVVMLVVFALAYVWIGSRCEALGKELKGLEKELAVLDNKHSNEACKWAQMKSPRNIERALKIWGIDMDWPRRDQVVWIYDAGVVSEQLARMDVSQQTALSASKREGYIRTVMNE